MNVTIKSIKNGGQLYKERLVLQVIRGGDIGEYSVFLSTSQGDSIASESVLAFWFPDKKVKAGDFVVLYTKYGEAKDKRNPAGSTTHFFYWGLEEPIWNSADDTAVLVHLTDWESKTVSEFLPDADTE